MTDEPFANPPHDDADEAALDRYVVRDRPVFDFFTEQARRAPWWTISLLVHMLALIVMWRWPIPALAWSRSGPCHRGAG